MTISSSQELVVDCVLNGWVETQNPIALYAKDSLC